MITRSDQGRDCRDAILGLAKTCRKLGISFWDFLGDRHRLGAAVGNAVLGLPSLIAAGALRRLIARTFAPVTISISN
ncbi:hypothetical protein [Paramagnetospirillum magneticum]|uniref:hypothetical protein n=1 Tax=Paramagnetospirillum magneticum TaxID=84159 RepID=UPI00031363B9|nr:hypothetical protein [Paramagnetospirillum magneticum]